MSTDACQTSSQTGSNDTIASCVVHKNFNISPAGIRKDPLRRLALGSTDLTEKLSVGT